MDVSVKAKYGLTLLRGQPERAPLERELQLFRICNALVHGQRPEAFPGMQPTSLTRAKVEEELLTRPYLVCEKTDGERNMLLALEGRIYLIDRVPQVWLCPLQLPLPAGHPRGPGWHHNTLLDGELVLDDVYKGGELAGEKCLRYLIYDVVSINGEDLTHRTLLHRLRRALSDVVLPKESVLREHPTDDPMRLYVKDFFELWHLGNVMQIGERLPHGTDGLVFTPVMVPYLPGSCGSLLKWKPASANTVDFKMQVVKGQGRFLHVKLLVGFKKQFEWHVDFSGLWLAKMGDMYKKLQADPTSFDNMIGECCWRKDAKTFVPSSSHVFVNEGTWEDGGWVLLRVREDKTMPNDLRTAKRVVESIEDDLGLKDLQNLVMKAKNEGKLKAAADCGEGELERIELPPLQLEQRRPPSGQGRPNAWKSRWTCRSFQETGKCVYGKNCRFAHGGGAGAEASKASSEGEKKDVELNEGEELMPDASDEEKEGFMTESGIEMIPRSEMEVCRWYARGCRRGLACPNLHPGDSRQSKYVPKDPELREKGGWQKGKGKSKRGASKGKSSEGEQAPKTAKGGAGSGGKTRGGKKGSGGGGGGSGGKGSAMGKTANTLRDSAANKAQKAAMVQAAEELQADNKDQSGREGASSRAKAPAPRAASSSGGRGQKGQQAKRQKVAAPPVSKEYGSTLLAHTAASLPAKAKAGPVDDDSFSESDLF